MIDQIWLRIEVIVFSVVVKWFEMVGEMMCGVKRIE